MKRMISALLCLALILGLFPFMSAPQSSAAGAASTITTTIPWDGRTSEPYAGGSGTSADPYQIANGAQLYYLALASDTSAYYKLTNNINLGNKIFPMISEFTGTLDGNGYRVLNLYISNSTNNTTGFVKNCTGTIKNLTLEGEVEAKYQSNTCGAFVAKLSDGGKIINCVNYCTVTNSNASSTGGFVGYIYEDGLIENCTNRASVIGQSNTGGICGKVERAETESIDVAISISSCCNIANVNGKYYVGGIIGYQEGTTIRYCVNAGNVAASNSNAGGIVGRGIAKNCTSVGYIYGKAYYTYEDAATFMYDCYNTGKIIGSTNVGGIAGGYNACTYTSQGYHQSYTASCGAYRVYNIGEIIATTSDGVCGDIYGGSGSSQQTIITCSDACYIDGKNSNATAIAGTAYSEAAMMGVGAYTNFDFTSVWTWDESNGYSYPILRSISIPPALCDHEYEISSTTATCLSDGVHTYECKKCKDQFIENVDALGHDLKSFEEQQPGCTSVGWEAYIACSRCEYTTYIERQALGHEEVIDSAISATCTETGLTEGKHCSRCDEVLVAQTVVEAMGHDYESLTIAPTCTEHGYTSYICSVCEDTYEDEYTSASGHSYVSETTAPNCTEQGCTTYTCTACGDTYADSYVDALGHVWDDGVQTLAPTCTAEGTKLYTCSTCGETKEEAIEANGHSYEDTVTAPTCTGTGYTTHTCAVCGDNYTDTNVDALGHEWNDGEVVIAATCTTNGKMKFTCTACGEAKEETILATGHNYVDTVTRPTCTETGYTTHTCSGCGDTYKDTYVGATGHAWNDGVEVLKATCTQKGEKVFTCGNCGETRLEEIAPLGHSYTQKVTAPICTEQGYTTHTCSNCGDSFVDSYTDAVGHNWDDGVVTVKPTTSKEGVMTYTCTRCGETKEEVLPKVEKCDGGADCPSAKFVDVKASDWFHEYVDFAVSNGLFGGMSANTFEPNTAMTRAMLVTVLWRYAGEPLEGENNFTDVPDGQWYTEAVAWAAHNGIVGGVGNNKFDPNGNITREQMAAILYRYANSNGIDTSARANLDGFPDGNKVSTWASDALPWANAEGLITGTKIGNITYLDPQGNATRAQVATILMRFIENIVG